MLSIRQVSSSVSKTPLSVFRCLQTSPIVWSRTAEKPKEPKVSEKSRKSLLKEYGPKRPISAFFRFCSENRPRFSADHPQSRPTEIASKLGAAWRALSDSEKQPYVSAYERAKEKYVQEREEFEKSLPPKKPMVPFFLYAEENRERLRKENPELTFAQVGTLVGERWHALSSEEKARYQQKYEENKAKWQQEKDQKLQHFKI